MIPTMTCGPTSSPKVAYLLVNNPSSKIEFYFIIGITEDLVSDIYFPPGSVVDLGGREDSTWHVRLMRLSGIIVVICTMIPFELVLLGNFNRNKNNLEENQGFVKLSAKPQLGRNEDFPPLVS